MTEKKLPLDTAATWFSSLELLPGDGRGRESTTAFTMAGISSTVNASSDLLFLFATLPGSLLPVLADEVRAFVLLFLGADILLLLSASRLSSSSSDHPKQSLDNIIQRRNTCS